MPVQGMWGSWRSMARLGRLRATLLAAGWAAGAMVAADGAVAQSVPLSQAVTQYAPSGLHLREGAPLSVTVGGQAVDFQPTADPGVYAGTVSGVTATVTFTWHDPAKALQWDIDLVNSASSASPPIVVAPMTLNLDADLTSPIKVVPCTRTYVGSSAGYGYLGTLRSFDTASTTPTAIYGTHTGTASSVLQVAMNTKSTIPAQACDEQRRSNLAGLYTALSWPGGWSFNAGWDSGSTSAARFVVSASTTEATASNPLVLSQHEAIA